MSSNQDFQGLKASLVDKQCTARRQMGRRGSSTGDKLSGVRSNFCLRVFTVWMKHGDKNTYL